MLSKKILTIGMVTTLLTGTSLFAQEENCANGACFASLNKSAPTKIVKEEWDKSITIVVDGDEITVFPSYKMAESEIYLTEDEMKSAIIVEELMEIELEDLMVQSLDNIEDVILEKSELKDSLYYCENKKQPQFNQFSDVYQCV